MACLGPAMANEDAFFKALEATRRARIEGGRLLLLDGAGSELIRLGRAE
jgi:heat shock protein HslJ